MKRLAPLLIAMLLAGCVNLDRVTERPATTTYELTVPTHARPVDKTDPRALLLLDTTADGYLEDEGMAYSRAPGTLARYQFARWSTWPSRRFRDLLFARLRADHAFAAVTRAGGAVRGDLLLDTRIVAFQHDAASEPGAALVTVDAELVDLGTRRQLGVRRFEARVPAASYDAAGAAKAFDQATAEVLDRMAAWVEESR